MSLADCRSPRPSPLAPRPSTLNPQPPPPFLSVLPAPESVSCAATRLSGIVRRTPLRYSPELSVVAGGDVYLKLENEQITGSFKIRGAYNALASLSPEERERGIVASSAGNHGLGIAVAARLLGIHATVFVPQSAPDVKKSGIRAHGSIVDDLAANYDDAEARARADARASGRPYVSPCAGDALLAGQGTVAVEVLADLPQVATIVAGVSGGGLVGGIAAWMRAASPATRIIGAQSDATAAMALSLAEGHVVEIADVPTLADGLAGQIDAVALAIGREALDDVAVLSEEEIAQAVSWLWRREGVKAEGAGAAAAAAVLGRRPVIRFPAVVVVSGGNIDPSRHASILAAHDDR